MTVPQPKILTYDLETTLLQFWAFNTGKQVLRHHQLVNGKSRTDVICMAWAWNDGKPAQVMGWGFEEQNSKPILQKLDQLIGEADIVIGKNNHRFDDKHVNAHRMFNQEPGIVDWSGKSDDLEKQIRKHFKLPSYSLDYLSQELGYGGKESMDFSDWVKIQEKHPTEGNDAYEKMMHYCCKDVEDTRSIWDRLLPYITPKFNHATFSNTQNAGGMVCKVCGSANIIKQGRYISGKTVYRQWRCKNHNGYAGKSIEHVEDSKVGDIMG